MIYIVISVSGLSGFSKISRLNMDFVMDSKEGGVYSLCNVYTKKDYTVYVKGEGLDAENEVIERIMIALGDSVMGLINKDERYRGIVEALGGERYYIVGGVVRDLIMSSSVTPRDIDICYHENTSLIVKILDGLYEYDLNRHGSRRYIKDGEAVADVFEIESFFGQPSDIVGFLNLADLSVNSMAVDSVGNKLICEFDVLEDITKFQVRLNKDRWNDVNISSNYEKAILVLRLCKVLKKYKLKIVDSKFIEENLNFVSLVEEEKISEYVCDLEEVYYLTNSKNTSF